MPGLKNERHGHGPLGGVMTEMEMPKELRRVVAHMAG